jgi:amino acid transporter
MAAANDGLLPAVFGRVSARGTPANAMVIAGVLASALVAMNYSRNLVDLFTFLIHSARWCPTRSARWRSG